MLTDRNFSAGIGAKRLVFDHFHYEGAIKRGSPKERILDAVRECLTIFQDELNDPINPTADDWKQFEELAAL